MYYLVAKDRAGQVVGSVEVTPRVLTIGRAPDCTLVLPSKAISRRHASAYLRPEDGQVVVADEGSANGVVVDGQYIGGPTLVNHNNVIQISEFTLFLQPMQPGAVPQAAPVPPPTGGPPVPAVSGQVTQAPAVQPQAHTPQAYGEGGAPGAGGHDEEEEENFTLLEAQVGAALALAGATLHLKGKGGPYDGADFVLDKPLVTVGRIADNDLQLDDPSISRRHAQIRLAPAGNAFTVLDLRSSNGTFVDGKRVKRADAGTRSMVRFGDLVFQVELRTGEARPKKQAAKPKRLLYIAGGVVVALLLAVGVVAYVKRPKPPPPVTITPEERLRQLQAEVQRFVDEGKLRISRKEWTQAVSALDKALDKDPINDESKKLRAQALAEMENEKTYEKGLEYLALGNKENLVRARDVFRKVPADSIYQREVRYKVKSINEQLAESYRIEGVSRCKARYWKECHEALCSFFELLPGDQAVPGESQLREQLQRVEKRLVRQHRRRRDDFEPCEAKRFLTPVDELAAAVDPDKLLADKYPNSEVRQVVLLYLQGKVDAAIKKVNALKKQRDMREYLSVLAEIDRQLLIIRGKYQEGYSALRDRDAHQAQKHWDLVLAADQSLIPQMAEGGLESFYRREVTRALGDLYGDLGEEQLKLGRYRPAYELLSAGQKASPKHAKVLNGLLQLEKAAERLLREGKALAASGQISEAREKLGLARDIVPDGHKTRTAAEQALAGLGG